MLRFGAISHSHVGDCRVLDTMGLRIVWEIKETMVDFAEEVRFCSAPRTSDAPLGKLLEEFGAVTDVFKTERRRQLTAFKKKPEWDIRKFRRRPKKLQLRGMHTGVGIGDAIQFAHLFQALHLSTDPGYMVFPFHESSKTSMFVDAFSGITIKFLGAYAAEPTPTLTSNQQHIDSSYSSSGIDRAFTARKGPTKKKNHGAKKKLHCGSRLMQDVWRSGEIKYWPSGMRIALPARRKTSRKYPRWPTP